MTRIILFTLLTLFTASWTFAQTPFETLSTYRQQYPTPISTAAQIGELLNRVAWDFRASGMRLLGKKSGANCPMPNGVLISCDYLVHAPTLTGHDVFVDAGPGGLTKPVAFTWGPGKEDLAGAIGSGSRTLVDPTLPDSTTEPGTDPVPNPGTPPPNSGTDPRLEELKRLPFIQQLLAEMRQQQLEDTTAIRTDIAILYADGVSMRDTFTFIAKYILPILGSIELTRRVTKP